MEVIMATSSTANSARGGCEDNSNALDEATTSFLDSDEVGLFDSSYAPNNPSLILDTALWKPVQEENNTESQAAAVPQAESTAESEAANQVQTLIPLDAFASSLRSDELSAAYPEVPECEESSECFLEQQTEDPEHILLQQNKDAVFCASFELTVNGELLTTDLNSSSGSTVDSGNKELQAEGQILSQNSEEPQQPHLIDISNSGQVPVSDTDLQTLSLSPLDPFSSFLTEGTKSLEPVATTSTEEGTVLVELAQPQSTVYQVSSTDTFDSTAAMLPHPQHSHGHSSHPSNMADVLLSLKHQGQPEVGTGTPGPSWPPAPAAGEHGQPGLELESEFLGHRLQQPPHAAAAAAAAAAATTTANAAMMHHHHTFESAVSWSSPGPAPGGHSHPVGPGHLAFQYGLGQEQAQGWMDSSWAPYTLPPGSSQVQAAAMPGQFSPSSFLGSHSPYSGAAGHEFGYAYANHNVDESLALVHGQTSINPASEVELRKDLDEEDEIGTRRAAAALFDPARSAMRSPTGSDIVGKPYAPCSPVLGLPGGRTHPNSPDSSTDTSKNVCNICGKTYARPSTLKTHLRTHSGERPYRCFSCNKSFSQAANLTAHCRTHSGEKPFHCGICDRKFSQSSSVTTHMRTHSGERPYRCRMCKKAFSDSSTLTKHLRIHSGEKPYQCKLCHLRFSQSGNLNRHMRIHAQNGR